MNRYSAIIVLSLFVQQSTSNAYAQAGEAKEALHAYYRKILRRESRLKRPEKKLCKALYGQWETIRDTTKPKDVFARKKLAADSTIQVHGIQYKKKGAATLYYTIGDSLRNVPWMWNVHKDTIFYGVVTPDMMGDTIVIKELVTSITEEHIQLRTIGRDTITSAVVCGTDELLHTSPNSVRPEYTGDLQKYLDEGFKNFVADKDFYRITLSFIVNCKGEVLKVYGFPASYNNFERHAAKLIRNSGKWKPAKWGDKTQDAKVAIEIVWRKGFIDIEFQNSNY